MSATTSCPSDVLASLREQAADTPLLALGQTVFWDEPMKAVVRSLLDRHSPGTRMVVGVHDTDYFARSRMDAGESGRFVLLPHNDGSTQSLWSAAGEISALFGSETVPRKHDLVAPAGSFRLAQQASGQDEAVFRDGVTEAWGWRGLVCTGANEPVVCNLPLRAASAGIMEMLEFGVRQSAAMVGPQCCRDEADAVAERIIGWCSAFARANPAASLPDLYCDVLPRLYELLLGSPTANLSVTTTSDLLRLTPATVDLPRFRVLDAFLCPATREVAEAAYNAAVGGSTMYTLDRFGNGAIPFDLIHPERGRGTLRITDRVLFAETRRPIAIKLERQIDSAAGLAEVVARHFNGGATVVGKAVTLIAMLASEFVFVFNEEGSMYVSRTRQLNDSLAAAGVNLDLKPLLRVRYETWDAMRGARSSLRLPPHLARAFGATALPAAEVAARWRGAVSGQREVMDRLYRANSCRALLDVLDDLEPGASWATERATYDKAAESLRAAVPTRDGLLSQVRAARAEVRRLNTDINSMPGLRGNRRGNRMMAHAAETQAVKRRARRRLAAARHALRAAERSPAIQALRREVAGIRARAELARVMHLRDAYMTVHGLEHTNHRPAAWWVPLVDSSGEWFRHIVDTTELYLEPLRS